MKRGSVTKANAVYLQGAVCGIVSSPGDGLNRGRLLWSEEFDYAGPPAPAKWVQENRGDGFGNNELQFYTLDRNSQVGGGNLVITSRRENFGGELI